MLVGRPVAQTLSWLDGKETVGWETSGSDSVLARWERDLLAGRPVAQTQSWLDMKETVGCETSGSDPVLARWERDLLVGRPMAIRPSRGKWLRLSPGEIGKRLFAVRPVAQTLS